MQQIIYKKSKNPQKVEETSIKLRNIQKFKPASISFEFNVDNEIDIILTEIYKKIGFKQLLRIFNT